MTTVTLAHSIRFDRKKLQRPNRNLLQFVSKLACLAETGGGGNRTADRHLIGIAFPAVPVDAEGNVTGEEFLATLSNLSTGGLSIIHNQPIKAKYFIVELELKGFERVQLMLQVLRCKPVHQYYEIAGKFVGRTTALSGASDTV